MAVVLPMAASVHHPSLLSTATTWTTGASTTSEERPHPTHQQNPHIRLDHHSRYDSTMSLSSPGRARSASTEASRTSSSPDSQASESPHEQSNRVGSVAGSGGLHNGGGSTSTSVSALGSMSMPAHRTRRPRRRADEVERLYKCTWNGCEKSYGTLSHLNDHVRLQRHGNKREPHGKSILYLF
jgi:transcription factor CON7